MNKFRGWGGWGGEEVGHLFAKGEGAAVLRAGHSVPRPPQPLLDLSARGGRTGRVDRNGTGRGVESVQQVGSTGCRREGMRHGASSSAAEAWAEDGAWVENGAHRAGLSRRPFRRGFVAGSTIRRVAGGCERSCEGACVSMSSVCACVCMCVRVCLGAPLLGRRGA